MLLVIGLLIGLTGTVDDAHDAELVAQTMLDCLRPVYQHKYEEGNRHLDFSFNLPAGDFVFMYLPLISEARVHITCDGFGEVRDGFGLVKEFWETDHAALAYVPAHSAMRCKASSTPRQPLFLRVCHDVSNLD